MAKTHKFDENPQRKHNSCKEKEENPDPAKRDVLQRKTMRGEEEDSEDDEIKRKNDEFLKKTMEIR